MRSLLIGALLFVTPIMAQASTVKTVLAGAEVRGEATFKFVGLPLYEARLYTASGSALDWTQDFAIELNYLRALKGQDLVDATLKEFERTGAALPLENQLSKCFDDVSKGDQYLAVSRGQNEVGFWRNGVRVCTLSHPQVKQRFMAIFVGENTRSRAFTQRLKGE